MHVAQDRENPLVSRIGIGSQMWWSRSDGQREERRGVRNHTNHWAGCRSCVSPVVEGPVKIAPTRSAETQPRDVVDNKNARSAARRCRSRCSKLTPRTRGAKEERGMSADST